MPKYKLSPEERTAKAAMLFQVAVYDIDIFILESYGLSYDTYLPEADEPLKDAKSYIM